MLNGWLWFNFGDLVTNLKIGLIIGNRMSIAKILIVV